MASGSLLTEHPGQVPARRGLLFAAACGGIASVSFAPAVHANYLTALSGDFHLSTAGASLYLSLNFWGALVAILGAGPLADRIGSGPLLLGSWLIELVSVSVIGLAPAPLVAYAGVLAASFGFGTISVLAPHAVSGLYPDRRARMMSLLVSFYTLGAVVSNVMVLGLFALGASWRVAYFAASALALPWGLLLLAAPHTPPPPDGGEEQEAPADEQASRPRAHAVLFLAICLAQTMAAAAEVSTSLWVPSFLVHVSGAPALWGPVSLLLYCLMGAVGKLSNAALVARVDRRAMVIIGGSLFGAGIVTAFLSATPAVALLGFGLAGLGTGGFVPAVTVALAERFPRAAPSRYSLFMAIGNLGPIGGPLLIGLAAAGDLRRGLATMLPVALLSCLLLLAVQARARRGHAPTPPGSR